MTWTYLAIEKTSPLSSTPSDRHLLSRRQRCACPGNFCNKLIRADDPAHCAYHARAEVSHEYRIAPALSRQDGFVVADLARHRERAHAQRDCRSCPSERRCVRRRPRPAQQRRWRSAAKRPFQVESRANSTIEPCISLCPCPGVRVAPAPMCQSRRTRCKNLYRSTENLERAILLEVRPTLLM